MKPAGSALLVTLLLALLTVGCAARDAGPMNSLPANARYVSLGSSFAAGAGIGPVRSATPARCGRTVNNYASLVAARRRLDLVDASCGGATTAHVLAPWNELPAQIDAVTADTRLVTITIGGNDLGLVSWLAAASCRAGALPAAVPCRPAARPGPAEYAKLQADLNAIAAEVRRRAPAARLVFVPYLALNSANPCPLEAISAADAAEARKIADGLAAATRRAARTSGADVIDVDTVSRDHTPCAPVPWSSGLPMGYTRAPGTSAPWHPNAAGHAAIADMIDTLLK